MQCLGHRSTDKLFTICVKFRFNRVSCFSSGKSTWPFLPLWCRDPAFPLPSETPESLLGLLLFSALALMCLKPTGEKQWGRDAWGEKHLYLQLSLTHLVVPDFNSPKSSHWLICTPCLSLRDKEEKTGKFGQERHSNPVKAVNKVTEVKEPQYLKKWMQLKRGLALCTETTGKTCWGPGPPHQGL